MPRAKQNEAQIEIAWDRPGANVNETAPANVAGYNIYRREGESVYRINPEPLLEPRYVDRNFQFGSSYQYTVRSLSLAPGVTGLNSAIESNDSAPLTPRTATTSLLQMGQPTAKREAAPPPSARRAWPRG